MSFDIKNCDILDGFKNLKDSSVDLVVTSPPYNVSIDYNAWNDSMPAKDYFNWVDKWLSECHRVINSGGRIAINIPFEVNMKHDGQRVFIVSEYWQLMKKYFNFFGMIRLDEAAPQRSLTAWGSYLSPSSPYIHNAEECVLLAYKDSPKKLEKGQTDLTKKEFIEFVSGQWKYQANTRPLTKVEDIPYKAIKLLSWKGDTVLDPFSGSGTTAVVCTKLERDFVGFEISEEYYKISVDRVQHEVDKRNCALQDMFN